jgi:hypothetical protein
VADADDLAVRAGRAMQGLEDRGFEALAG